MRFIERFKSMPAGVKASLGLFVSSMITKGIAYITTPLYTRLLSAEEYGQTSVFLTWLQVLGIIAMFCLSAGVFNNGMLDYPNDRDEYSLSMLGLSNIITIIFSCILLLLYPYLNKYIKLDLPYIVLMCVIFLFQPAYNFWTSRQRYELKYKAVMIWSILSAFLSPLLAIVCIMNSNDKLKARIFGAESVLVAIYTCFYIYILVKGNFHVKTKYWKQALKFNFPLIPHYLSTYLLTSVDILMISHLISNSATAYYSVAHSVAAISTVVWAAINSSLVPFTYEKCKNKEFDALSKVTIPIIGAFAVISILIIMLAPEVVKIMATKDYLEAIYVIPPIVGGVFFQVQYYIYANVVYYYKQPKYVMIASVTATLLNIVLNYFFISLFGYVAAGYTTIISYIVQVVIDYFAMKKVVGHDVYNMKYILVLSIAVIGISLVSILIYDLPVIRYAVLICIIVVAILNRNKVKKIILFNS